MKVDPRRLLDLLSVARYGSFSGAAEATRISQPALSKSIALLEMELGVRVLERDRQGARLNEFGKDLAYRARALESLLEQSKEAMRLRALGIEGSIGIGVTPVTAVGLVPLALKQLIHETPKISVSVTEGLDCDNKAKLRAHELDIIVGRLGVAPFHPDIVETDSLIQCHWSVIMRPGHPLAELPDVALKTLDGCAWVLPADGIAFRRQMEAMFTLACVPWPTGGITTNSILAIKAIVMNTDCVALMPPRMAEVECAAGRLHAVPLHDLEGPRPVGLMWRRDEEMSPIAARFANIMHRVARDDPDHVELPARD